MFTGKGVTSQTDDCQPSPVGVNTPAVLPASAVSSPLPPYGLRVENNLNDVVCFGREWVAWAPAFLPQAEQIPRQPRTRCQPPIPQSITKAPSPKWRQEHPVPAARQAILSWFGASHAPWPGLPDPLQRVKMRLLSQPPLTGSRQGDSEQLPAPWQKNPCNHQMNHFHRHSRPTATRSAGGCPRIGTAARHPTIHSTPSAI